MYSCGTEIEVNGMSMLCNKHMRVAKYMQKFYLKKTEGSSLGRG
jgi:hypothetical protein